MKVLSEDLKPPSILLLGTHTAMELPSLRVRDPATDKGRGVTAGSAQSTSSPSTTSSADDHCHVSFTDLSDSGRFPTSHKTDTEGFQRQPQKRQHQRSIPSQQHLNPLFDLPETFHSAVPDNGRENRSPTDERGTSVTVSDNGGESGVSGAGVTPPKPAFSAVPLALSEKPSLGKRQSTKQLLKPKNALEVEVGPRDTMEKIAIKFQTTPSEICKMNKMASRMIFPGQILFVPDPDASPVTPSPTKEPGATIDVMFPAAAEESPHQHQRQPTKNGGNGGGGGAEDEDVSKIPSLPSLPSFTSVTAITGGVSEASKDAGAAASSQFSSLISKLNPATAISRTSLRKKKNGQEEGNANKNNQGGGAAAADVDPDQECLERFLKLDAKHITDGRGVVAGTLLVTPNAIMFDPHVMDPLVIERSAEEYGMMAPMECVMSATLYNDISRMSVEGMERKPSGLLAPAYHGGDVDIEDAAKETTETGGLKSVSTEQRLSDALGEKASAATHLGGCRDLTDHSSKEPSASREVTASPEGRNEKRALPSSSNQHLVKADEAASTSAVAPPAPAPPFFDLEDSVFESSLNEMGSSTRNAPTQASIVPSKVLFGDMDADRGSAGVSEAPLHAGQIEISVACPVQLTNTDTRSTLAPTSQQSPTCIALTNESAAQLQRTSDEQTSKSVVRASDERASNYVVRAPNGKGPALDAAGHVIAAGETVWYADLSTSTSELQGATTSLGSSATVLVENAVDPEVAEHLFQPIHAIVPGNKIPSSSPAAAGATAAAGSAPPLMYLCLKVGQPLNKRVPTSGPIASYAKKKKRPEYWFTIPKDRAPRLYAFFLQWTPEVYDNRDEQHQQAFVVNGNCDGDENGDDDDDEVGVIKQLVAKEWQIVNTDEIERRRSILFSEDSISLLPEIIGESTIFDEELVRKIHVVLPARAVGYPWSLVFSTEENGFSLNSLYRKMAATPQVPVLMFIKDTNDKVFGAMSSCSFIVSDHFYGNGEMFLFSLLDDGELRHWPWSGENSFFIKGNKESLAIGAGEGLFGLWLDEDLYHGRSHPCPTFGNDCLSSKEDFVIKALEIWAFLS